MARKFRPLITSVENKVEERHFSAALAQQRNGVLVLKNEKQSAKNRCHSEPARSGGEEPIFYL
jgi:hypothetical protein